jgi:positive regulator of sigma E activity
MELMHKLFFRRFSAEEYKQLIEIHIEETKQLRKRVQFIVGLVLLIGLFLYFSFRAILFEGFKWEYLVYALIILTGFISVNDSIREYFCERLLQERQKHGET